MSEWIPWHGGDFGDTAAIVEAKLRNGSESGPRPATAFYWRHDDSLSSGFHIVGYRVVGMSRIVDAVECNIETGKPLETPPNTPLTTAAAELLRAAEDLVNLLDGPLNGEKAMQLHSKMGALRAAIAKAKLEFKSC